jgi:hypothetical protein
MAAPINKADNTRELVKSLPIIANPNTGFTNSLTEREKIIINPKIKSAGLNT